MKKGMGVLNILFIIGMILGTIQPAMLYGGETPSGNIWDQFVDPKPGNMAERAVKHLL